jgi:ribokinase
MAKPVEVVTLGSICMDIIMSVNDVMRFETFDGDNIKKYTAIEYSSKVNVGSVQFAPGGSASNIACDLAMIGTSTRYLGIVGKDINGDLAVKDMVDRGVDVSFVERTDADNTGVSIVLMSPWGKDRSILAYKGSVNLISPNYVREDMIKGAKLFAWTSLTSTSGIEAIDKAIDIARKNNIIVMACPSISILKNRQEEAVKLVKKSTIISLNNEELQELTGENTTIKGMKKLISWGLQRVAVTMGSKGSRITDGKRIVESGIYEVPVVDTTGAGDAFASGILCGTLKGFSLEKTAQYASALSAFEIKGSGVRIGLPTSQKEFETFIANNKFEQTELSMNTLN